MSEADEVQYEVGGPELLESIRPLWLMLREHHRSLRTHFRDEISGREFDERKAQWFAFPPSGVRVELARARGNLVGYCVTTIDANRVGEVDSLFILESLRRRGIGDAFMRRALAWLDENNVRDRVIEVAAGNEQVWPFYARYGFYPRRTVLKPAKPSAGPSPC
jgi:ribosomal protein S18 acetylase RimI-like enzyme